MPGDIENHSFRQLGARSTQRGLAIVCRFDGIPLKDQTPSQHVANRAIIFNNQYALCHAFYPLQWANWLIGVSKSGL